MCRCISILLCYVLCLYYVLINLGSGILVPGQLSYSCIVFSVTDLIYWPESVPVPRLSAASYSMIVVLDAPHLWNPGVWPHLYLTPGYSQCQQGVQSL